jgi:beta-galactosidase/beta-glucuronidase
MTALPRFAALFVLSICLFAALPAPVLAGAPPPARRGRDLSVIDGAWKFLTDPGDAGETKDWTQAAPSAAKEIVVPSLWGTQAAPDYRGVAWYWREFEVPAAWKGQTARLRFEAVADRARVWLNGKPLGEHDGGSTPFEFTVTRALRIGERNLLAVRVEGDGKAGAGIWQGVLLMAHDEAYIADCFPQGNGAGGLTAPVVLLNTSGTTGDATLEARLVLAKAPKREIKSTRQILHVTPGRNLTTLVMSLRGSSLKPWSLDQPQLYLLQLAFGQDKDILDTQETPFGFREFGVKDRALTLNGAPLTLVSAAPKPERPIVIATTDDTTRARELLHGLKTKGVTVVYLDAPPPALLRLADEEGMLIVEGAAARRNPRAMEELRALILRDRAHPSILAWNVGDDAAPAAAEFRQLDPTRFLLVGPAASSRLWLPNQNETTAIAPPPGLLPLP